MRTAMLLVTTALCVAVSVSDGLATSVCLTSTDHNCFTGNFGLVDILGDPQHKLLKEDFGYIDPDGLGWQTNKGTKTDGASIPPLLQTFVGSPWEDGYIRAAVIHDWYCDRHVRPFKATHRVFYNALIASGLNAAKAKLIFYAVYTFGPSWGYPEPGKKCSITENCIQMTENGAPFIERPDRYSDLTNISELKALDAVIEVAELTDGLSLEQLMAIADKTHPKLPLLDSAPTTGVTK